VARKLDVKGFIQALAPHPLLFEPGAAWSYCNSGYNLLGRVVEQAAGQSYWECLRARIFLPLGMSASQSRDQAVVITNRAAGYEWERGRLVNRDSDLTDVFAAGAIVSTITDLAKWNAALDGDKLLCGASREQMWTPVRLNSGKTYPYGFGWRVDDYRGWRCVSHSGSTAGFSSSAQRYPEDKLVVIVLCNLGTENVATQVGRGVAGLYLGAK
jgi:CubicO group peptidase (beta-lactamase class C family)